MKQYIYTAIAIAVIAIATSCEKELFSSTTSTKGGISLSLNVSNSIDTRAAMTDTELKNSAKVNIYLPLYQGLIREYTFASMPEVVYLPVGEKYRVDVIAGEAINDNPRKANFEQKSYKGSAEFDVVAAKTDTKVAVTAKISNAITNVTFDQTIFDNFGNTYSLKFALDEAAFTDENASDKILDYNKEVITLSSKTKEGYFIIDPKRASLEKTIYWSFSGTTGGEPFSANGEIGGLKDSNGNELTSLEGIKINMSFKFEVKDGKLSFSIGEVATDTEDKNQDIEWNPTSTGISISSYKDTWATFVDVYADVDTSTYDAEKVYFQYRLAGSSAAWSKVQATKPTEEGGKYSARITGLTAGQEYEYQLVVWTKGESAAETVIEGTSSITTANAPQVPNNSFEYSSTAKEGMSNYDIFYDPSATDESARTKWWDSGNIASSIAKMRLTYLDETIKTSGKYSILLHSKTAVGKLAAGNLYSGFMHSYSASHVSGIVCFGRKFEGRPSAIELYVKYIPGTGTATTHLTSGSDEGQIRIALGRWYKDNYGHGSGTDESPVAVNTADQSTFIDYVSDATTTDGKTLAYGDAVFKSGGKAYINGSTTAAEEDYADETLKKITIPIKYYNTTSKVTHIIISCAASRFGDYFEGYEDSKMWIDDVKLIYDENVVTK